MSNLQIGLLALGLILLLVVLGHNLWLTRRSAPRSASRPGPGPARTVRVEPVLEGAEPLTDEPPVVQQVPLAVAPPPAPRLGLDGLIDAMVPLGFEGEVSGEALLAALPGTRRIGSRPFALEGLNVLSQQWEAPRAGQRYSAAQAGIQLANRHGAMNQIEFSEFVVKVQACADAVSAAPDFPDMMAEVQRARELDAFASAHDAQLGLTLRPRRALWSPGFLMQQAAELGFIAGALPGRMVLPAQEPGMPPVLSLLFDSQAAMSEDPDQSALRDASLLLEVTHVVRHEAPFERLRSVAQGLAEGLDGVLTDDRSQPLDDATLDGIAADLEALYQALEARDLAAGSPQARRLFS